MTEQTLRKLTRKKTLTGKQRASLLREVHRRLATATQIMYCVSDSCGDDAEAIDANDEATREQETRAERLEDARDELEALVETLDNLDMPEPKDVL